MGSTFKGTLGGVAVVCCPHDREKRQVRSDDAIARLGREIGVEFDPRVHKVHDCACCENFFVDPTDTPRFCHACQGALAHPLGGPLPSPIGVVT